MEAYEVRMTNELYELESRLAKLNAAISATTDHGEEYILMVAQKKAMTEYRRALKKRCDLHGLGGDYRHA